MLRPRFRLQCVDEAAWTSAIIEGSGANLLLDLHNLYANAFNFGERPETLLMRFPLHRVRAVHLSGGKWIAEPAGDGNGDGDRNGKKKSPPRVRLLDDHVHDVPPEVFELLTLLAEHAPQPLDVIIERDGEYPKFECLLSELETARTAIAGGRLRTLGRREAA